MSEEDAFSVNIDIPKPRSFNDKYKDNILQKRIKKKRFKTVKKRSSPENNNSLPIITKLEPLPSAAIKREEILLPYLRFTKREEKDRLKERLKTDLQEEYKIAFADLQKRLHIDDPVDDIRGVTSYDPTFFMCVKSSTLSSYVAPYKSLKYLFNSQLRWRQEVGYRRDCMLNIETKHKKEQEVYETSVKRCKQQVKYLDEFISADYKKSMSFLSKWDKIKTAVDQKTFELQCWATKKFTITSKIIGLDYRYGLQQKYGRFLYYLSPPSWRVKNRNFAQSVEIEAKGFAFGISGEEDTFNVIFENLKKDCVSGLIKPALYFQHPNDLLKIFDGIEQQHLHHFTHVARLAPHTSFLKKGIKLFRDIIEQDSAGVMTIIKEFETMLQFCEEQCFQLKTKFFKILNSFFYDSVGAVEVLKYQLHLEFCYSKVYNEKPMNLGVMGTAKALEDFYMDYIKRMESLTAEGISSAIKESLEEERRKFRRAKRAAKELRLFEQLEKALLRAFAPIPNRQYSHFSITYPTKVKRSAPKKVVIKPAANYQKRLTDTEMEYLSLFTDWTEKDNPAHFLRSLSMEEVNIRRF